MEIDQSLDWVKYQIHAACLNAARKHQGYVEREDLEQECWVYILERQELIEEDTKSARKVLGKSLQYHLDRYGMRQRTQRDGTHLSDYFRYTARIVEELMPMVLDGDSAMAEDVNEQIRSNKPLSERGDMQALVADIQKVYLLLGDNDRVILSAKFSGGGVSNEVLGIQFGLTQQAAWNRVNRALARLAKQLNGDEEPRKMRRIVSNSTAQVWTRKHLEEL